MDNRVKHGMYKSKEYRAWIDMRRRCSGKRPSDYHRYCLRGIKVCDEWEDNFLKFYSDMGPAPSKDHSLDRIDNDGGYSKDNCRWATRSEQNKNKSFSVFKNATGVHYHKRQKKYNASYGVPGRNRIHLGCYNTFEEARLARLSFEIKIEVVENGLLKYLTT